MDIHPSRDLKPGRYALCRDGRLWIINRISLNKAVAIVSVTAREAPTPPPAAHPAPMPTAAPEAASAERPGELVRTV